MIEKRYHTTMMQINEKASVSDMKAACPLFFKNSRRGEKRKAYRGCIMVEYGAKITVYAFDVATSDMNVIFTRNNFLDFEDARNAIDNWLDTPEENPLTTETVEIEVLVPVKIAMQVFRDQGRVTSTRLARWIDVANDNPGDGLVNKALELAKPKLRDMLVDTAIVVES